MNESELINHLRASGHAQVSPEVTKKIQQLLAAEFDRVMAAAPARRSAFAGMYMAFSPRPMFATAFAAIILTVGLGTTAIANAAKPGDALFGWDQATEKVRLALTFGDDNKAKYEADVAEERVAEKIELESEHSDHATEAAELTNQALDHALTTVVRVRTKLEGKNGNGAEALTKVELRLRTLQGEHAKKLKIETKTKDSLTRIKVEFGRAKWEWTSTATTAQDLLVEIVGKTGLPVDDVRALLRGSSGRENRADDQTTTEDDSADDAPVNRATNSSRLTNQSGSKTNTNRKGNRNSNSGANLNRVSDDTGDAPGDATNTNVANTNVSDDAGEDLTNSSIDTVMSIRVRVDLEKNETDIMVERNGVEHEWELSTTSTSLILDSIAAKTGLTGAAIQDLWDFQQE